MMSVLSCVLFFKQKTAYEMRISDWSSDVCSSDLSKRRWVAAGSAWTDWFMTRDWLFAGAAAGRDGYGSGRTGGTTAALGKSLVVAEINRKPFTPMERSEYRRMAALKGTLWWFRALHASLLHQIGDRSSVV